MNIIYILNNESVSAGSNRSLLSLLEEIRKKHNIVVVVPSRKGIYDILKNRNIKTVVIKYIFNIRPNLNYLKDYILFLPRYIKRKIVNYMAEITLMKFCKQYKIDLIHTNTTVNEFGYNAAKRLRIPHVMHVREYGDKDHGMHIYGNKKRIQDPSSWNIFITEDIARYFNCENAKRSRVIYNPIINDEIHEITLPKQKYFLYAGRINEGKSVDTLINAYIQYCKVKSKEDISPLYIAGAYATSEYDKQLYLSYKQQIFNAGLSDYVSWLGERSDINDLMRNAKVVIVPSRFEGFGRVMPEAQAEGTLVIGRDSGGLHEQFENGVKVTNMEIGLRFNDESDLVRCMCKVDEMNDEEYRDIVGASQKAVTALYSQSISSQKVLKLYKQIFNAFSKYYQ